MKKYEAEKLLSAQKLPRFQWDKAVREYAFELLDTLEDDAEITRENLLNGADSWREYSWGGCSLIYNNDIAARVCTEREYLSKISKKTGELLRPNKREEWLDVQARALYQASCLLLYLT